MDVSLVISIIALALSIISFIVNFIGRWDEFAYASFGHVLVFILGWGLLVVGFSFGVVGLWDFFTAGMGTQGTIDGLFVIFCFVVILILIGIAFIQTSIQDYRKKNPRIIEK